MSKYKKNWMVKTLLGLKKKSIEICDNCCGEGGECPRCRGTGRIIKIETVEYIPYTKLDWDRVIKEN